LATAAALAQDGALVWSSLDNPVLTMRDFSDEFLDAYLDRIGDDALASPGAYQLEGQGAHLFSAIDGDFFSILGLPLLPLLAALRARAWIAA
jgi:septum formation protein